MGISNGMWHLNAAIPFRRANAQSNEQTSLPLAIVLHLEREREQSSDDFVRIRV
jgi:hypothetical protein